MAFTIAISGKGGSGKTTIAAMIIRALLSQSSRGILAVDADPNSCLGLMTGAEPAGTVAQLREDALNSRSRQQGGMDKMRFFEYGLQQVITEEKGFDLVAMGRPEGPGCYCAANNMLRKFMDKAAGTYDFVVIDNEAGMEHLSRRTTNDVDLLFIVAESTPIGVVTAKRIFELVESLPITVSKIGVIWNKENNSGCKLEGISIFGCIPYDDSVVTACADGGTIFELDEESPAFSSVRRILHEHLNVKEKST
jgi:CO dehydrogenase maturation factor